ncbi:MAG: hypothetical protein ACLQIB_55630 [Isosphaeraceae bacterium]
MQRIVPAIGALALATITASQTYQTDLLPGFELPLGRLPAIADRWQ